MTHLDGVLETGKRIYSKSTKMDLMLKLEMKYEKCFALLSSQDVRGNLELILLPLALRFPPSPPEGSGGVV